MTKVLHRHFLVGKSDASVCGAKRYGTRDPKLVTCPKCRPSARAILYTNAMEAELVERGPCPFQQKCDDDCGHE